MDSNRQQLRRRQLDQQLIPLRSALPTAIPAGGWIHAIREALGMSLQTFASRLGLASASTAHQLERAEVAETITVKRLRAAADALGCDVAIVLVPRVPLADMSEARARKKATDRIQRLGHSMVMEGQGVPYGFQDEMIQKATKDILEKGDPKLWE